MGLLDNMTPITRAVFNDAQEASKKQLAEIDRTLRLEIDRVRRSTCEDAENYRRSTEENQNAFRKEFSDKLGLILESVDADSVQEAIRKISNDYLAKIETTGRKVNDAHDASQKAQESAAQAAKAAQNSATHVETQLDLIRRFLDEIKPVAQQARTDAASANQTVLEIRTLLKAEKTRQAQLCGSFVARMRWLLRGK